MAFAVQAVPARHCDALVQLADAQKLWMNSSLLLIVRVV